MSHPTLRQQFDSRLPTQERPAVLGWADFFQWFGEQTAAPRPRGPLSKLIHE